MLAGSRITNTGPSVITGDIGLSPGTVVSGFPPGLVLGGTIHATDGVALQAKADLKTAYDDAAGRSSTATISADLAGRTLMPGVYTSASSLGLSGDLTLDAQGDPAAVFVFQAGSTLTAGSGSRVLFIGGAQPCNVFWQVGSSASIGSGSAFAGNILALTSITLTTGATLNGRALARNGAVTLDTNLVTKTACRTSGSPSPTAADTSATTGEGQPVSVVLHGADAAGATLTYGITSGPSSGTLGPIDQGAGTVTFTPAAGQTGPVTFVYQVVSSSGTSNPATATVMITPSGGDQGQTPGTPGSAAQGSAGGTAARPKPLTPAALPPLEGSSKVSATSAQMNGPSGCVGGPFEARVSGSKIAQVKFFVDTKWLRTMKAKPGQTVFSLRMNPRRQSSGVHHVVARLRFKAGGGARSQTLRMVYKRCATAATAPQFTG